MSLLHFDGFEQFTNDGGACSTLLTYSGQQMQIVTPGRFGYGQAIQSENRTFNYSMPSPANQITIGQAVKFDGDSLGGNREHLTFYSNAGNQRQFSLVTDPTGAIHILRGNDFNSKKASSAPAVVTYGVWYYIEVVVTFDRTSDTGSSVAVYLDDVKIAEGLNVNLRDNASTDIDTIAMQWRFRSYIDDLYIRNDLTRMGDVRVVAQSPDADTAQKDFTNSGGGSNASNVDELPFNISDYVISATAGAKDVYGLSNLPVATAAIYAVAPIMLAMKDDAAARTLRMNLLSGAATLNGPTQPMASSFSIFRNPPAVVDPDTGAAWTEAAVNALQLGIEVVS